MTAVEATPRTSRTLIVALALAAAVGAAATAIYGAYGASHPVAEQENAVPFLVGADIVVTALLFAVLVPWAGRQSGRAAGWGLAAGIVALVATPVSAWSGVPLILAALATLLGRRGTGRLAGVAMVLGIVGMILSTAMVVVGNTVLA